MTRKEIVTNFLENCSKGICTDVFENFVSLSFKHHNPYYKADAASLKKGMEDAAEALPTKTLEIKFIWEAENNTVISYSLVKINPQHIGVVVFHVFKFNIENKIEELWDVGQQIPEDVVNELGMF